MKMVTEVDFGARDISTPTQRVALLAELATTISKSAHSDIADATLTLFCAACMLVRTHAKSDDADFIMKAECSALAAADEIVVEWLNRAKDPSKNASSPGKVH